jgi:hypothetical protein
LVLLLLTFAVAIPALRADTLHTNETIAASTSWTLAGSPHIVVGSCSVQLGATLTIQAGCTLRFDAAASMSVYGNLSAPGTAGQPIVFTRRDPTDEWWGLYLYTGGSATLSYATVEYATYTEGYGISCNGAFPSLDHCTFRYNDTGIYAVNVTGAMLTQPNTFTGNLTHAVYFSTCSAPTLANLTATGHGTAVRLHATPNFHLGTGNAITGNTWALTMDASSYPAADCAGNIPLAGNTNNDGLAITGGTTFGSIPWRDVDADYILTAGVSVGAGSSLTIDPSVTVRFDAGTSLSIYGNLNVPGSKTHYFIK